MNLNDCFNFLNFWISKEKGAYYTISELEQLLDSGQMSLFEDLSSQYATSQRIKDALSPFREAYNFTTAVSGYVIVPSSTNYLRLLDLQIYFNISDRTVYYPVQMVNEDERASRLNSQVNPVTVTSPIGEQTAPRTFRLYPAGAYNGNVTFLRRPVAPVFGYTLISGRIIQYNSLTSTQLEWGADFILPVLTKSLLSIGINLSDDAVTQFAAAKTNDNYNNVNML